MIRVVIFDLNGVLVKGVKLSDVLQANGKAVPMEKFLPALRDVLARARLSHAPDVYTLWMPFFQEWGVTMSRDELYDKWFHAERENTELTTYLRILKATGLKLIVLSNNFRERTDYYATRFPFLAELFDRVYYSHESGYVKPDVRAFQQILQDFDFKPEECLYFDDNQKNVETANLLGIKAYLYKNVEQTKKLYQKLADHSA